MNILFGQDQSTVKEKALHASMSSMSSSQIVSASALHNKTSLQGLGLPAPVSYPPPVTTTSLLLLFYRYPFPDPPPYPPPSYHHYYRYSTSIIDT